MGALSDVGVDRIHAHCSELDQQLPAAYRRLSDGLELKSFRPAELVDSYGSHRSPPCLVVDRPLRMYLTQSANVLDDGKYEQRGSLIMSAYVVVDVAAIEDAPAYAGYRERVTPGLLAAGGRYLVRGGRVEVLEGSWTPGRLVVVEFESVQAGRAWWESPGYRELRDLRQRATRSNMILVEGLAKGRA
jgi:uncharacterized protein (DUF1330 family)